MRTRSLFHAIAFLCAASVQAQGKDAVEVPAWAQLNDSLGHVLDLTNDQMKLVQLADEHYREHVKAGDPEAMTKREQDLKAALLPTQYTKWQEVVVARKPKK